VAWVRDAFRVSSRTACRATGVGRSFIAYRSRRPPQDALRRRLRELAAARASYGYLRLHTLLRREGWAVDLWLMPLGCEPETGDRIKAFRRSRWNREILFEALSSEAIRLELSPSFADFMFAPNDSVRVTEWLRHAVLATDGMASLALDSG
jgi:hypothetical protein